jgi:hypothetical protein
MATQVTIFLSGTDVMYALSLPLRSSYLARLHAQQSAWVGKRSVKLRMNLWRRQCQRKFFVASWVLPGSFLGHPGELVSNIINKEDYRKPQKASRKPQGSYKKFQGRKPYNSFVAILENLCPHKLILSLTDL